MTDFITLHSCLDNDEADVHVRSIAQIKPAADGSTIYFIGGSVYNYKESLQEIRAIIRELDADPLRRVHPAPSNMGKVESKHGRVTE